MLQITIPSQELWDGTQFLYTKEQTLKLEHSLVSLAKWESKWCKPFLSSEDDRSSAETIDYVKCMTLTPNVDPYVYKYLTRRNLIDIDEYITAPMTATWFTDAQKSSQRVGSVEQLTAELIYYWMISLGIPFECEKWHLNRLLTLIRVCSIKQSPPKKMTKQDVMRQNAALNAARMKRRAKRR